MRFIEFAAEIAEKAGYPPGIDSGRIVLHVNGSDEPVFVTSLGRTHNADWIVEFAHWRVQLGKDPPGLLELFSYPFLGRVPYCRFANWTYALGPSGDYLLGAINRVRSSELDSSVFIEIISSIEREVEFYNEHIRVARQHTENSRLPPTPPSPVFNVNAIRLIRDQAVALGWRIVTLKDGRLFMGFPRHGGVDEIFISMHSHERDGDVIVEFTSGGMTLSDDDKQSRTTASEYLKRNHQALFVAWGMEPDSVHEKTIKLYRRLRLSRLSDAAFWNVVSDIRRECEAVEFTVHPRTILSNAEILEVAGGSE